MKKSLIRASMDFIIKHFLDITLFVLFLIIYTGYILANNLTEKKTTPKLQRMVIFENMSNHEEMKETLKNGFCSSTLSDNNARHSNCGELSQTNCNAVECCVYAKDPNGDNFSCVAGDKLGPTFISNPPIDEYYYLGKLYKR